MFLIIPNPVVKRLRLPESLAGATEELVRFPRYVALPALQNLAQRMIRHRPKHSVNMVWHNDPRIQSETFVLKKPKRLGGQISNLGSLEPAFAPALVQIVLELPKVTPLNLVQGFWLWRFGAKVVCGGALSVESLQPFGALGLVFEQNVLWQRIHETERDEVSGALAFHVREVSPCVDSRTQRIGPLRLNACGAQLMLHAFGSRISLGGDHDPRIARSVWFVQPRQRLQRCSAELHSAVSQICNLQRARRFGNSRVCGRFAECNSAIRQIENLRCENGSPRQALLRPRCRSAELHSAISQICNLQRARRFGNSRVCGRFAECNSAIRQIENLRYDDWRFRPLVYSSDLAFIAGLRASAFGF
jgi:hypothetical protein